MKIDPEASMRCWAVTVNLGDHSYRIPPLPAADWLPVLVGSYYQIVPGLVDDPGDLDMLLLDGTTSYADCEQAAREAITEISGMNWWSAVRLTQWLHAQWPSLGALLLSRTGGRLDTLPIGAALAITYRTIMEHCEDQAKRQSVDMELERPPDNVPIEEAFDEEQAAANFMALGAAGG